MAWKGQLTLQIEQLTTIQSLPNVHPYQAQHDG